MKNKKRPIFPRFFSATTSKKNLPVLSLSLSLTSMKKQPRVIPDRHPLALAPLSSKLSRSAIDARITDEKDRRAKRLTQAMVFRTVHEAVPPLFWPGQVDHLMHPSVTTALSLFEGLPAPYPAAPALGPAEKAAIDELERAVKNKESISFIDVDPTRALEPGGLELLFNPRSMINDDFLDVYLATMNLLYQTDSRNFFFISFLESAEAAAQTIVTRHLANPASPLARFFLNDDGCLYGAFNIGGCHWIAFKWDRAGYGRVTIMDSLSPVDYLDYPWKRRPEYIGAELDRLRRLGDLPEPKSVDVIKVPKQLDGVSCGLYALLNIRKLALGIDYQSAKIADYRRYMLAEIITQRIPLAPVAEVPPPPPIKIK